MKEASRPYRNQRLFGPKQRRQQHLLEVSLRADKERERRVKLVFYCAFRIVLFVALAVGAWVGTKAALRKAIWENPSFQLSDVRITTDGTLTREQIINAGGITEGRNIFLVNLEKIRSALDALPQVERVDIQRTLPNRIDVEITERQPIAWVAAKGDPDPTASERSFLIDARGYVMRTHKLLPDYYTFPIITGVETENLYPGQLITTSEVQGLLVQAAAVQAALDLIRLNADSTRWQVRSIDVSKGYCLVVTDRVHSRITFGLDHIDQQLARLYRILDVIEPTHREIQTVNLFVERNTPVTFADATADAPASDTPQPAQKPDPNAKPADKGAGAKAHAEPQPKTSSHETHEGRDSHESRDSHETKKTESTKSRPKKHTAESESSPAKTLPDSLKKPFRL